MESRSGSSCIRAIAPLNRCSRCTVMTGSRCTDARERHNTMNQAVSVAPIGTVHHHITAMLTTIASGNGRAPTSGSGSLGVRVRLVPHCRAVCTAHEVHSDAIAKPHT